MKLEYLCAFMIVMLCSALCAAQSANVPQIGYLYPAGGRCGTTIQIVAGGQYLNGADKVYVSGEGVRARVVKYIRPFRNLQKEQRQFLQKRLRDLRNERLTRSSSANADSPTQGIRPRRQTASRTPSRSEKQEDVSPTVKLPEHPLLLDLEKKSLRELAHVANMLFFPRMKLQMNRQLAETVLIEVTIAPEAEPGSRELRIATRLGLTSPVVFDVASFPEVRECEPNNRQAYPALSNLPKGATVPKDKPLDVPVVCNGQIMPGDIDRFRFRAEKGQKLVIETRARGLIPYLADAVPGWFQAVVALYDDTGNEVAFADDYRFEPDPVMFYDIPKDGEYELEIRDSIYRGREDFVYRVVISERPFITRMFPLGGVEGERCDVSVAGWNLSETSLSLDTRAGGQRSREIRYSRGGTVSNSVPYAVGVMPEISESENNDTIERAAKVNLPTVINGRIEKAGDVDVFGFSGKARDTVVLEIDARRLHSPLDALVRLTDAFGTVIAWNDDWVLKDEQHLHKDVAGLLTHHADPYLSVVLPRDGIYFAHVLDTRGHGGPAHAYRLRISEPMPDFALRVTPSSISLRAGSIVPIEVHALRKDGYEGPIEVAVKDPVLGFSISGATIPPGSNRLRMTLTAPARAPDGPVALELEGRAEVHGRTIVRPVVPAEDKMQAFLYRHLVPSRELFVEVQKSKWRVPAIELAGRTPVRIVAGQTALVRIKTGRANTLRELQLELQNPPAGVSLHDVALIPGGLAFRLSAERDAVQGNFGDNLIVEAYREFTPKAQPGKPPPPKRRSSMGVLPAIPVEVVMQ